MNNVQHARSEELSASIHTLKSLLGTAVQAYYFAFLSSIGSSNHFDLYEKLFMLIAQVNFLFERSSTCSV